MAHKDFPKVSTTRRVRGGSRKWVHARGAHHPSPEMVCDFLIKLEFCSICLHHLSVTSFISGASIGVRAVFYQGGGEPFAQKIIASCPKFYETVEKT